MADPSLSVVVEQFTAQVQKNRLVAIPSDKQRSLGLRKRRDNHLMRFSIRKKGRGRWNHHYAKLSFDSEFALPTDLEDVKAGDVVEVKVHRLIADIPLSVPRAVTGAEVLVNLAEGAMRDDREAGAAEHDAFLNEEAIGGGTPRRQHGR